MPSWEGSFPGTAERQKKGLTQSPALCRLSDSTKPRKKVVPLYSIGRCNSFSGKAAFSFKGTCTRPDAFRSLAAIWPTAAARTQNLSATFPGQISTLYPTSRATTVAGLGPARLSSPRTAGERSGVLIIAAYGAWWEISEGSFSRGINSVIFLLS